MIRPRTVTTDDARSHVETSLAGRVDVLDDEVDVSAGQDEQDATSQQSFRLTLVAGIARG